MSSALGKSAVVTGGAKGIGKAIALDLAAAGYHVAVLDPLADGEATAREAAAFGGKTMYLPVDVSSEPSVQDAARRIREEWGAVDVLVNNAGIHPRESFLEHSYAAWKRTLDVNLGGTFLCSQAFARGMMRTGGGAIVNIASVKGLKPSPNAAAYAASKAGIIALTRNMALELAPLVRVNAVLPGLADTDQPREGMAPGEDLYARGKSIPMGRIASTADIAKAVRFFVGEEASYVTGQSLCVNGGALMQ